VSFFEFDSPRPNYKIVRVAQNSSVLIDELDAYGMDGIYWVI